MRLLPTLILASLALGCQGQRELEDLTITDSLDFSLLRSGSDDLDTPYVAGSAVTLFVNAKDGEEDFEGWTVRSLDPEVFELTQVRADAADLDVEGRARDTGIAILEIRDDWDRLQRTVEVEVARPDRVDLQPRAASYVESLALELAGQTPRILQGGTATFEVTYWEDQRQLHGTGVLSVSADPGLSLSTDHSSVGTDREWLVIEPSTMGSYEVQLSVDGRAQATALVEVVHPSEVVGIEIFTDPEVGLSTGEQRYAVAMGIDPQGRPLQGLQPTWTLGHEELAGAGDVFSYEYDSRTIRPLAIVAGVHEDETFVHGMQGELMSSNEVGCSTVSGATGGLLGLLGALGLILRRRD